jgi:hypothetical protein
MKPGLIRRCLVNQVDFDPDKFDVDEYGNLYPKEGSEQGITIEDLEVEHE